MTTQMKWTKTENGYTIETSEGVASVTKSGKSWSLTLGDHTVALGRRVSFDRAEGALAILGVGVRVGEFGVDAEGDLCLRTGEGWLVFTAVMTLARTPPRPVRPCEVEIVAKIR